MTTEQIEACQAVVSRFVSLIHDGRENEAEAVMDEWNLGYEDDPGLVAEFGFMNMPSR